MIKTYKSNTNISINVVLENKSNLHVSFTPLSNGSSVYTTDNEEIQKAIERHYNYNNLFRLVGAEHIVAMTQKSPKIIQTKKINDKPKEIKNEGITKNQAEERNDEQEDNETSDNLTKVNVSDLSAAKDYLADKFGVSRTSMKKSETIIAIAKEHGIEFEGLD